MDNDIIDISLDFENLDNNSGSGSDWNRNSNSKKSNFGGGIELLMNEKRSTNSGGPTSDIDLEDLNNLESELNDLANDTDNTNGPSFDSGLFGMKNSFDDKPSVRFDEASPSVGQSTFNTASDGKTWDGYGKFNNIPVNPDRNGMSSQPKLSKDDLLREKFKFLRKLEALEKKGVELTKKYNMDSDLAEMQGEYEMIMEEKTKQNSVKFQGNMMMAVINGIEFLNNRFDPFDVKLDGWGEQINENINDYDDVFGELYEKYKSKATLAPELKLMFQLGGSAMMVHMTNTMFKSAMPGMDDIMRQNPELMRQFQNAAVNSMSNTSPGFSGFMGGLMNPTNSSAYSEPSVPQGRGPPAPLATQGPNSAPPSANRGGNNVARPDISMARGSFADDGISIRESNFGVPGFEPPMPSQKSQRRPEMKGPSDINDILSGLKTKTINIAESAPSMQRNTNTNRQESQSQSQTDYPDNNSSTISINDLKDLQNEANVPKRSRRKPKSDKNTVSLDI
jgi:hypothetical protein